MLPALFSFSDNLTPKYGLILYNHRYIAGGRVITHLIHHSQADCIFTIGQDGRVQVAQDPTANLHSTICEKGKSTTRISAGGELQFVVLEVFVIGNTADRRDPTYNLVYTWPTDN